MNKIIIKIALIISSVIVNISMLFISNNYISNVSNQHTICNTNNVCNKNNSDINVNENWHWLGEHTENTALYGFDPQAKKQVRTGWIKFYTKSYYIENETEILNLVISKIFITPEYIFDENEKNDMMPKDLFWPLHLRYYNEANKPISNNVELYDYFPKQRNPEWSISYNFGPSFSIGTSSGCDLGVSISYSAIRTCPEIINESSISKDLVSIDFNYDVNSMYLINDLKNYVCRETTQIVSTLYKVKKNPKLRTGSTYNTYKIVVDMVRNKSEFFWGLFPFLKWYSFPYSQKESITSTFEIDYFLWGNLDE